MDNNTVQVKYLENLYCVMGIRDREEIMCKGGIDFAQGITDLSHHSTYPCTLSDDIEIYRQAKANKQRQAFGM